MAWYCDRCGEKLSSFSDGKYNSKDFECMKEHSIPSFVNICGSCWNYLFDDLIYKRLTYHDVGYLQEPEGKYHNSSRFYPNSRRFDIEYNLLDSESNLYWNEDYDDVVDFVNCYEELEDKFSSAYEYSEEEVSDDDESPIFSDNADEILQKELFSKSTCAAYKSLIESVNNTYQTRFASDFQTYVTRLGLIINRIVENRSFYGKNHYPELLKFICNDILDNDYIYKMLIKINPHANDVKHSLKDITVNIRDSLIYYNSMIDKLRELSGCKSFEKCHIFYKKQNLSRVEFVGVNSFFSA